MEAKKFLTPADLKPAVVMILIVILITFVMLFIVLLTGGHIDTSPHAAYIYLRDDMQNAIDNYKNNYQGDLPLLGLGANTSVNGTTYYIIDVCRLVDPDNWLRYAPEICAELDGPNNDNCDSGECICDGSAHYIWLVDANGSVYSVCDENLDGDWLDIGITSGLYETVDGYHDEVFP